MKQKYNQKIKMKRTYSCIFHSLKRIIFDPILIDEIPSGMLKHQNKTVTEQATGKNNLRYQRKG